MIPSGPHSSTMGTGERSSMPTVVCRLCDHPETGPKPVSDQLRRRMSAPISPPPKGKLLLFPKLAMRAWNLDQSKFLYREDLWHTRAQLLYRRRLRSPHHIEREPAFNASSSVGEGCAGPL